ncbi:hypothetical protein CcaverHIS002_0101240 [Cutaneotrichosporon cavernicola]|uniref:Uncharacterized protein n=1 Tax=Cutaneotrichosporon cavernicola TaxID=279322 RepID=A0AA48I0Q9_9TREE|nr:uncharacterized protein CcaverHIS019_0101220 [Cutaneotrichosporon cavernicola]BEI79595.1 hypothetical protein CcaverHIS002_0101240 [Cutaneotrichosporon cavernicola]BEI87404.1 hypothetical protein CcaverHIS019_0101220 [Cutaneotrichosporon cavernicola]BEI95172.1 hypothetical protein CcaverHIS631_0101210 [Cutaneotrichosporon cavernicola]BEJ02946.1 hypothetical protein CcaverHIS641_0101210 [Cutaneotrichosporon cavernicola]
MAPHHARSVAPRGELSEEGAKGIKIVVPAVIGAIFGMALVAIIIIWVIARSRMKRRENKFWKQAEARNSIRQSRMMVLSEQGSLATRDSYATLDSLASGTSGSQVFNSTLIPSFPSERSLRASMMSLNSSYSSPYDSSPLASSSTTSRLDDPWDTRSDADPGEGVPMLTSNRSPRPSLAVNAGSNKVPAYDETYESSSQYPQVIVSEHSEARGVPEPSTKMGQYSTVNSSEPSREDAIAAAAAQLEGHDYEYSQAIANAAAAASKDAVGPISSSTNEVVRSDGGHFGAPTITQVSPTIPIRQSSISAEVVGAKA